MRDAHLGGDAEIEFLEHGLEFCPLLGVLLDGEELLVDLLEEFLLHLLLDDLDRIDLVALGLAGEFAAEAAAQRAAVLLFLQPADETHEVLPSGVAASGAAPRRGARRDAFTF